MSRSVSFEDELGGILLAMARDYRFSRPSANLVILLYSIEHTDEDPDTYMFLSRLSGSAQLVFLGALGHWTRSIDYEDDNEAMCVLRAVLDKNFPIVRRTRGVLLRDGHISLSFGLRVCLSRNLDTVRGSVNRAAFLGTVGVLFRDD